MGVSGSFGFSWMPGYLGEEQQLVGLQRDGGGRGHLLHREIERLAGGGEAEGRQQDDRADVDRAADGHAESTLRTTPLCMKSTPSTMPTGPGGEEVAGHDPHGRVGHRRVGQALRERGLDLEAQLAGGLLRAVERHLVGDAHAVAVARRVVLGLELVVDLRPEPVHQHQLHAHRVQDGQILYASALSLCAASDHLAGDRHHEGLAVIRVDVRRHGAEPRHESVGERPGRVLIVGPHSAAYFAAPRALCSVRLGCDPRYPESLAALALCTSAGGGCGGCAIARWTFEDPENPGRRRREIIARS